MVRPNVSVQAALWSLCAAAAIALLPALLLSPRPILVAAPLRGMAAPTGIKIGTGGHGKKLVETMALTLWALHLHLHLLTMP